MENQYSYSTEVEWTGERGGDLSAPDLPDLEVDAPPEFKGHEGVWTPEHLFVAASYLRRNCNHCAAFKPRGRLESSGLWIRCARPIQMKGARKSAHCEIQRSPRPHKAQVVLKSC